MFDSPFEFKCVRKTEMNSLCAVHLYRFKANSRQKIMVEVHEFIQHPVCIIKFYDRDDRNSANRFTTLTKKGNFGPIFRTCIEIMLEMKEKNPYMSFAFMGAQTPEEKRDGKFEKTKRYRIYEYGMTQFFTNLHFSHAYLESHSLYMLFNRDYCDDNPERQNEILKCIKEIYPDEPIWEHLL